MLFFLIQCRDIPKANTKDTLTHTLLYASTCTPIILYDIYVLQKMSVLLNHLFSFSLFSFFVHFTVMLRLHNCALHLNLSAHVGGGLPGGLQHSSRGPVR